MAAATKAINTPTRAGLTSLYPVAAATVLYAGTLGALNGAGYLVPASDTAGLRVVGLVQEDVDNSAGAAGDLSANVTRGVFQLNNSGTNAAAAGTRGKICFVEDDNTVAAVAGAHSVIAGTVVDVDDNGVWVEVGFESRVVPVTVALTSTNGTAGAAADLAALKAEAEKIGDDVRAVYAALVTLGILK